MTTAERSARYRAGKGKGINRRRRAQRRLTAIKRSRFHAGTGPGKKHYWLTPPDMYSALDAEFHFDFDPCPYPLPPGFNGLTCEWGSSNYVNPPFSQIVHQGKKRGFTAWVHKALEEHRKGKLVVLVYPFDKWVLLLLEAVGAGAMVRNLGEVKWRAIEDGSPGNGNGRHIACFILDPKGAAA
jgi:hypothetical protein